MNERSSKMSRGGAGEFFSGKMDRYGQSIRRFESLVYYSCIPRFSQKHVDGDYELLSVKTTLQATDDLVVGIFDSSSLGRAFAWLVTIDPKNFFLTSR
jgi:hypothetical protein